uniref:Restorer of fertility-like protein n=1 Tax=Triticum timopheevii TaxID=4570 RepID=A0A7S5S0C6_TRITI|nr:restorer of fertility-like protein [Triticum timopheevii]
MFDVYKKCAKRREELLLGRPLVHTSVGLEMTSSPMCRIGLRHRRSSSSTSLMSRLRLLGRSSSSTSTSPRSRPWSPHAAFAAATQRVSAGTFSPEHAHQLFDELLRQGTPVPDFSLDGFLAALARATSSAACRDGPALALALFNRLCREEAGPRVAQPTIFTYGVLMNCCVRTRRPQLGLAFFGRVLRTDLKTNTIVFSSLLKCLCHAKRTDEDVSVLLHRMPELGCVPDAFSYTIVLKSLCDDSSSQRALDLLQTMEKGGGVCSPDVVSYTTVIHGLLKEGEVSKACSLFDEMVQQGVVPNVVTYSSIIDALCKAGVMDKTELVLRQMVDSGIQPDNVTYTSMIHGYSTLGRWKEADKPGYHTRCCYLDLIHDLPLQAWKKQRSCRNY